MHVIANEFDLFWVQLVFQYDSSDSIRFKQHANRTIYANRTIIFESHESAIRMLFESYRIIRIVLKYELHPKQIESISYYLHFAFESYVFI